MNNVGIVLSLSGVPRHLDSLQIKEDLLKLDNVQSVEELKVWALTTDKTAALVHLQLSKFPKWKAVGKCRIVM